MLALIIGQVSGEVVGRRDGGEFVPKSYLDAQRGVSASTWTSLYFSIENGVCAVLLYERCGDRMRAVNVMRVCCECMRV